MINTNSTVFKFASCAACTVMAVLATLLVSNKYYRNGFFNFAKTQIQAPVSQDGNTNANQTKTDNQKPATPVETAASILAKVRGMKSDANRVSARAAAKAKKDAGQTLSKEEEFLLKVLTEDGKVVANADSIEL